MPLKTPLWPPPWPEIEQAVIRAIRSGQWGKYHSATCQRVKNLLADRFQTRHVRLCCSGSAAIEVALRAGGVGSGDEVIVSAYDYPGNFRAVELVGARPVLVDVAQDSAVLDPSQLEIAQGERVRAVIASHLFGVAAEVDRIRSECDRRGWILIEDACQVPGMVINGRPAGSFGHFAALSFGGSKPVTSGCGGALLTSDDRLAARLGPLLDRPSDVMPLSPLQAAVLEPQLERLGDLTEQRYQAVCFLEQHVVPKLADWQWLSPQDRDVTPAYYKIAWAARSDQHRSRIVDAAIEIGIPMGEGFRDMSRSSDRRCRKPVQLDRSARLGQTVFVLDHRSLLLDSQQHRELGDSLIELHQQTSPENPG